MKAFHIETYGFDITYCWETFVGEYPQRLTQWNERMAEMVETLEKIRTAWAGVDVKFEKGSILITCTDNPRGYEMALGAAEEFKGIVKHHSWWKEVNV